jgi:hypothetical protein
MLYTEIHIINGHLHFKAGTKKLRNSFSPIGEASLPPRALSPHVGSGNLIPGPWISLPHEKSATYTEFKPALSLYGSVCESVKGG